MADIVCRVQSEPLDVVSLGEAPRLTPEIAAAVDRIWADAKEVRGSELYDGSVFAVSEVSPGRIEGRWTTYRNFFAQRRSKRLRKVLAIRALAVTGVVLSGNRVLLARRSQQSEQDPGGWEFAPAGSVERIDNPAAGLVDTTRHLLLELFEEIGQTAENFETAPKLFGLIEDEDAGVVDLVYGLSLRPEFGEDLTRIASSAGPEHTEFALVPIEDCQQFLLRNTAPPAAASEAIASFFDLAEIFADFRS